MFFFQNLGSRFGKKQIKTNSNNNSPWIFILFYFLQTLLVNLL